MRTLYTILYIYTVAVAVSLLSAACSGARNGEDIAGEPVAMKHATLLTLLRGDGYIFAEIRNPWDTTKVLHRYVLVPKAQEMPTDLPQGDVVRIPLERSVVATSVHCSLLTQLGAYQSIAGVCDADFIYLDRIRQDVKAGKVLNLGSSIAPDMERLLDLHPDAILLSPFENSGTYGKVGKSGVPIVECADYMESTALGRAEWMRFYGLLYGREAVADSLFGAVEARYDSLKALAATAKRKPKVVADVKTGMTWYVAGANSTMGHLYQDAGGDYVFKSKKSCGSVPYDPEKVFDLAQNADIWLLKYNQATDKTLEELASDWANNAQMQAYKARNVFGCNLNIVPFYEETPFHPDLLLRELVKIFHPDLLPDYSLRYFKRME